MRYCIPGECRNTTDLNQPRIWKSLLYDTHRTSLGVTLPALDAATPPATADGAGTTGDSAVERHRAGAGLGAALLVAAPASPPAVSTDAVAWRALAFLGRRTGTEYGEYGKPMSFACCLIFSSICTLFQASS